MPVLSDELKKAFMDKEYRHGYVEEFLNNSIATQIKVLREQRAWNQSELAEKTGMKQSAISRLEDVNYSSWNIKTLQRLAEAFDLTLRISFDGFGERLDDILEFSKESLERLSFKDDPVFKATGEIALPNEIQDSFSPKSSQEKIVATMKKPPLAQGQEQFEEQRRKVVAEFASKENQKSATIAWRSANVSAVTNTTDLQ